MKDINKIRIWMGAMFFWGITTGRVLPQWEDIANSPYQFAEIIMYWFMIGLGLIVIFQHHKIKRNKE